MPEYHPNEDTLSLPQLNERLQLIITANEHVKIAEINLQQMRIQRDTVLYDTQKGMIKIGQDIKKYIKSLFGTQSSEYTIISGIILKNIID